MLRRGSVAVVDWRPPETSSRPCRIVSEARTRSSSSSTSARTTRLIQEEPPARGSSSSSSASSDTSPALAELVRAEDLGDRASGAFGVGRTVEVDGDAASAGDRVARRGAGASSSSGLGGRRRREVERRHVEARNVRKVNRGDLDLAEEVEELFDGVDDRRDRRLDRVEGGDRGAFDRVEVADDDVESG